MMRMIAKNSFRVLHAPTTVGGNPQGLSSALTKLGVFSKSLTLSQNYFNYPADYVAWPENQSYLLKELKRLFWLLVVIFKYDIIHYNFGTTISNPANFIKPCDNKLIKLVGFIYRRYRWYLQFIELNVFKVLNKKLFVTYQGNDARQGDYSLENFEFNIASQVGEEYYTPESDAIKQRLIKRLSHYCESVYALNPDLLHVLPKSAKFMPYSHIFLDEWTPHFTQLENRKLRIGHAPSNRKVKGTDIILDALNQLASQGYEFEVVLVEGISNAEAKEKYETIDVLIDQIFAGWYGGLAVEVMALGKPVLVYIRDDDLKYVPHEMADDLPCIRVDPVHIKEQLRQLLEMSRQDLLEIAKKSRAYVEKWHDPIKIASSFLDDYRQAFSPSNY